MKTLRNAAGVLGLAVLAAGQQPSITNANLQTLSAAAGLEGTIRSVVGRGQGPLWIGYAVAKIPGEHNSCCWQSWNNGSGQGRGCGLEGQRGGISGATTGQAGSPIQLEGPTHAAILLRVESGNVQKVRTFSVDCPLDAGGLTFVWLTNVRTSESVALLSQYVVPSDTKKSMSESAVHAIALHSGPEASAALERFASPSHGDSVRKSALFWLANSRGRSGFQIVSRISREDTNDKIREHAIFALTQSGEAEAIPSIIRIAKEDRSAHVRGQALFWLAQKASRQASQAISEAVEQDPETEVKKKAVFALSQLPAGEGVPKLIEVARRHNNPAVRKQAMFWLGQSKDSRAIQFFESVLTQ